MTAASQSYQWCPETAGTYHPGGKHHADKIFHSICLMANWMSWAAARTLITVGHTWWSMVL